MKGVLYVYYRLMHSGTKEVPYMYQRTIIGQVWHTIRKFICQIIAPNCVTNFMRVNLYRLCGFKIGKHTFIGMKCYMDDIDPKMTVIGDDVTISYGVFFACHGRKQSHHKIVICDRAYIGMGSSFIAPQNIVIGEHSIIGARTLVNKSVPDYSIAVGVPCRILDKKVDD